MITHTRTHTLSRHTKITKKSIHKQYNKNKHTPANTPDREHPTTMDRTPKGTVTKATLQDPTTHMQGTRKNI